MTHPESASGPLKGPEEMQNVEFKAELRDLPLARSICLALGAVPVATLEQTDTYFKLPAGRLKRREVPDEPTQYVFYHRADRVQPKLSHFTLYTESEAILRYAVHNLPVWLVVKKSRELLMLGGMRIHLDRVDGLGTFLEVECLVTPANHVAKSHHAVQGLRQELSPALGELISCGYSDLLAASIDQPA